MMRCLGRRILAILAVAVVGVTCYDAKPPQGARGEDTDPNDNRGDDDVVDKQQQEQPCRLWLAPSHLSTSEVPRLGVYAGVAFAENETLPGTDLALPLTDLLPELHGGINTLNGELASGLESFLWSSSFAASKFEGNHSSSAIIPGLGILANHHSGYHNVAWEPAATWLRQRQTLFPAGQAHPARGAVTPFDNITMRAIHPIPAGMELFAYYGDEWNEDVDKKPDIFQDRLTRKDYQHADAVLEKLLSYLEKYEFDMTTDLQDAVMDFVLDHVLEAAAGKRAKVIRSLLPAHVQKLRRVQQAGGTFLYRNRDLIKAEMWLKDHGTCLDTLYAATSTIPEAGRGAFAARSFEEGERILSVPFLPILNEELINMYRIIVEKTTQADENDADGPTDSESNTKSAILKYDTSYPIGAQVTMNYCYGHSESNMFLIPVAPLANLINHATKASGAVNAYFTWAKHDWVANDHSLHDRELHDWAVPGHMADDATIPPPLPMLIMDLVAARDINHNEEILIDYGKNWQDAWEEYYQAWKKTNFQDEIPSKWPLKAADVQQLYRDKPFPINLKRGLVPYPPGVITTCFIRATDVPDGEPHQDSAGHDIQQWVGPVTWHEYNGDSVYICDLVDRQSSAEHMYVYAAYSMLKSKEVTMIVGIPHTAIQLHDGPYSSDLFTRNAFRRWIDIDDQRFPQAWRNLR